MSIGFSRFDVGSRFQIADSEAQSLRMEFVFYLILVSYLHFFRYRATTETLCAGASDRDVAAAGRPIVASFCTRCTGYQTGPKQKAGSLAMAFAVT